MNINKTVTNIKSAIVSNLAPKELAVFVFLAITIPKIVILGIVLTGKNKYPFSTGTYDIPQGIRRNVHQIV